MSRISERLAADRRRVVVFDDDPTGTQTVSDVDVLLDATPDRIRAFFASEARSLYVLTNTRALSRAVAVDRLSELHDRVRAVANDCGVSWTPLLRGDSTLRGHVFAEIDAIAEQAAVVLFVPAFPEGGRTTVGGQHFIETEGTVSNVADTEYARDPTFGYLSRDLPGWVAEIGGGRPSAGVPLAKPRELGSAAVTSTILHVAPGTVVIPDAVERSDLEEIAVGLLDAEAAGRSVVVRSAATFAAIRCGLASRLIDRVVLRPPGRLLVACGSYTEGSRAQLAGLQAAGLEIESIDLATDLDRLSRALSDRLDRGGVAVVATPRQQLGGAGLASGAALMATLVALVERLTGQVDGVVAKGGITSAEIAVALGAHTARVDGQIMAGVAVWTLDSVAGGLPYAVVPGNVGAPDTLVRVVAAMGRA